MRVFLITNAAFAFCLWNYLWQVGTPALAGTLATVGVLINLGFLFISWVLWRLSI